MLGLCAASASSSAWADSVLTTSTREPLTSVIATILNANARRLADWESAGRLTSDWANNIDKHDLDLIGFKPEEMRFFRDLIVHAQAYKRDMFQAYIFVGDNEPGKSYREVGRAYGEDIPWDEADENYLKIVDAERAQPCKPANPSEDCSIFAGHYSDYADALLQKAQAAWAVYELMRSEGGYSTVTLKSVLEYGVDSGRQVYAQVSAQYLKHDIVSNRDELLATLRGEIQRLGG